jgi:hypothetical protein
MFRFQYSPEFLKWALQPPGYHVDWHLGRGGTPGCQVGYVEHTCCHQLTPPPRCFDCKITW